MKKTYFLFAILLALASCNKTSDHPELSGAPLRLVVLAEGSVGTRATGIVSNDTSSEAKVNSLQVFVFNGDALDGYGTSTGTTATVDCTSGSRDIYAVVNAPSLASVTHKSDLLSTVSTLADEVDNFQMIGHKTQSLKADGAVKIEVGRLAARIVLRGIKNALGNAAQAAAFKIRSIYLINVAGDADLGQSASYEVSKWYNQRGRQAANHLGSLTGDEIPADRQTIAPGGTYEEVHCFYSYPNRYPGTVGGPWSPRAARLVIQAEIAGAVYDYPILLPALESNKSYEINLVSLTRVGNLDDGHEPEDDGDDDEERPVVGFGQAFEIIVNPWNTVLVGDDGNITL